MNSAQTAEMAIHTMAVPARKIIIGCAPAIQTEAAEDSSQ